MKHIQVVFHPFFFAIYAILGVYAPNIGSIAIKHVTRPLITLLMVTTLLYHLLRYWTGNNQRAGFLTTIGLAWLFFIHIYRLLVNLLKLTPSSATDFTFLVIWSVVLFLLGSHKLWSRILIHKSLTDFLNITSWIILILPLYLTISTTMQNLHQNALVRERRSRNEVQLALNSSVNPDIYLIILDAYGRADFLEKAFYYNNTDFITFLEEKGFYVAENSRCNYPQTLLSVASLLNLSYLDNWTQGIEKSNNRAPLEEMINESSARRALEKLGYVFFTASKFTQNDNLTNNNPESELVLNRFEELVLSTTVFDIFTRAWNLNLPIPTYETHRNDIRTTLKILKNIPATDRPKFVYVHILAPHPPFVFGEDGKPVDPSYAYTLSDGEAFPGSTEAYTVGYAKEISYLNHEMKAAITAMLENSQEPPIIILQGDHGPGNYFTILGLETESCLQERFSILNAYYFPDQNYDLLYPSITPVNSLRVVFNKYFNAQLPLIEDRSYYASYAFPYQFSDVTAQASTCTIDFSP